jgi:hypothetical protein
MTIDPERNVGSRALRAMRAKQASPPRKCRLFYLVSERRFIHTPRVRVSSFGTNEALSMPISSQAASGEYPSIPGTRRTRPTLGRSRRSCGGKAVEINPWREHAMDGQADRRRSQRRPLDRTETARNRETQAEPSCKYQK